jgi:hypothetical protein
MVSLGTSLYLAYGDMLSRKSSILTICHPERRVPSFQKEGTKVSSLHSCILHIKTFP